MRDTRGTTQRCTYGHGGGELTVGRVQAGLNEVLPLGLRDERLEFGSGKGVHKTCFADDE
jgi:hypothetical protein